MENNFAEEREPTGDEIHELFADTLEADHIWGKIVIIKISEGWDAEDILQREG